MAVGVLKCKTYRSSVILPPTRPINDVKRVSCWYLAATERHRWTSVKRPILNANCKKKIEINLSFLQKRNCYDVKLTCLVIKIYT